MSCIVKLNDIEREIQSLKEIQRSSSAVKSIFQDFQLCWEMCYFPHDRTGKTSMDHKKGMKNMFSPRLHYSQVC